MTNARPYRHKRKNKEKLVLVDFNRQLCNLFLLTLQQFIVTHDNWLQKLVLKGEGMVISVSRKNHYVWEDEDKSSCLRT